MRKEAGEGEDALRERKILTDMLLIFSLAEEHFPFYAAALLTKFSAPSSGQPLTRPRGRIWRQRPLRAPARRHGNGSRSFVGTCTD